MPEVSKIPQEDEVEKLSAERETRLFASLAFHHIVQLIQISVHSNIQISAE